MKTYKKGDNFKDKDSSYKTYGITEIAEKTHAQKIEVYGDIELRNLIIKLLNKYEKEK